MEKRKFKPGTYSYRPLKNLKEGTVVDVYGIVKFFKLPFKTRGTDFMMIVTIVDESLIQVGEKLKCLLFSHEEENLPQVKIGSVIRFHRLRVNVHNRELQGRNGAGFSWLVVDNQRDGCLVPKTSSTNYTFTDFDRQKIKSLFCVKLQNQELRSQDLVKNLQQLREGIYFDFLCQVVAVSAVDLNVCYLLQVWDGNHPSCPLYAVEVNERNMILHTDMELRKVAKDWLVDVCVFDDHCEKASTIKPGMFVKLLNLHCPRHKIPDIFNATYSEELELVLHGGTSYGRGIKILSETDPEIEDLKMKLEQLRRAAKEVETTRTSVKRSAESSPSKSVKRKPVETGLCSSPNKIVSRTDSEMTNESDDTSSEILTDSEADIEDYVKDAPEIVPSTATGLCSSPNKIVSRTDSEMTNESDDTSSEILTDSQSNFEDYVKVAPKILFSVVSVIQGHQSVEFAHICDIINTPAPMKFRLLTRVWDYCPKLTSVSDFLSLFCPECNYTTPINNYKLEPSTFHIKDGVEYYRCPYCASKNISDDVPLMEYIFLLRFVLTDGHYFLIANLWRDEAVKFFRQITPLEFISDANVVNKVRSCLARIHSRRMKNKNKTLIECCIKSFHGHRSAVCYEMFDTFLS